MSLGPDYLNPPLLAADLSLSLLLVMSSQGNNTTSPSYGPSKPAETPRDPQPQSTHDSRGRSYPQSSSTHGSTRSTISATAGSVAPVFF